MRMISVDLGEISILATPLIFSQEWVGQKISVVNAGVAVDVVRDKERIIATRTNELSSTNVGISIT